MVQLGAFSVFIYTYILSYVRHSVYPYIFACSNCNISLSCVPCSIHTSVLIATFHCYVLFVISKMDSASNSSSEARALFVISKMDSASNSSSEARASRLQRRREEREIVVHASETAEQREERLRKRRLRDWQG